MDKNTEERVDAMLYRFADYIKHHERTGLGGNDNQYTIRNEIVAAIKQAELRGRIEELEELEYHDMKLKYISAILERVTSLKQQLATLEKGKE